MKIAIMQPYIFPYIGYMQMVNAVDTFVFYDDVNFIKQGWVNRNNILVGKNVYLFTIPLEGATSFCEIRKTKINQHLYGLWKTKFLQTLTQNYKKAPFFEATFNIINEVLNKETDVISGLAVESVQKISEYLDIKTKFKLSSNAYNNKELDRKERLIDICKKEGASYYINAIGGQKLYQKQDFAKEGIQLSFIKSKPIEYQQFKNDFVPWLSIIDVMMFNSVTEIKDILNKFELH